MRTRSVVIGLATAAVGLGIVLGGVRAPAQESPAVKQGATGETLKRLGKASDPVARLQAQVADLQKELAAQKAQTAKLEQKLNQSNDGPDGYATTLITKTNWDRLPGNTLLKVWLRE